MIKTIYKKIQEYISGREDIALEVRMHPSVYHDCMSCDYNEVVSAFNLSTADVGPCATMFNYRLVIDFDFDENEWRVQSPRIIK